MIGIFTFFKKNLTVIIIATVLLASAIGYFKWQDNKIKRLEKEKIELIQDNLALETEINKKVNDHTFDYIPRNIDKDKALTNSDKEHLKKQKIKEKDVESYAKVNYGIDTTLTTNKIESKRDTIITLDEVKPVSHKLDFSNKWVISEVEFKSLKDSVFDAKHKLILEDSLQYVTYTRKEKVGTKRFLIFFRKGVYQRVIGIRVTNSNELVKLKNASTVIIRKED